MHSAEQIAGFLTLAEEGKTPAQIGDALGFSTRHVQLMLKLANLAPSLMDRLTQDDLTVEQCQALCLEDEHDLDILPALQGGEDVNETSI